MQSITAVRYNDRVALADAYLAVSGAGDRESLDAVLRPLVDEGRAAWPTLSLEEAQFCACLARHLGSEPPSRWPRLHVADLWLACACATGDERAVAELEARYRHVIDSVVGRMRIAGAAADEVKQRVRERLLVAAPDRPPRIASYSGRGELAGWLRAAATRVALNFVRLEPASGGDDALIDRLPAAGDDPELRLLKTRHAQAFNLSFRDAVASLEPRQRLLLKEHYLDGLSTEALGALHRVHRVTVARWLDAARAKVAAEVERRLGERLRLPAAELQSLLRAVRSRIDVSLHDCLAEPP